MASGLTLIQGRKTLFSVHLMTAYVISVLLWVSFGNGTIYGYDVAYYKYMGLIHLIIDRFWDLIFIMGALAALSACRGIKRVQATIESQKSAAWIVLDVVIISAILTNVIGIGMYIIHRSEFTTAGVPDILMVQTMYTFIGLVIGVVVGSVLTIINLIWFKWFSEQGKSKQKEVIHE